MRTKSRRRNTKLAQSFNNAIAGLTYLMKSQRNTRYHTSASIIVFYLAFWLQVTKFEFAFLIVTMALVWSMEAINTSCEKMLDMVSPRYSKRAKRVKDMAASAVLLISVAAAVAGLLILSPPLHDKILSYR